LQLKKKEQMFKLKSKLILILAFSTNLLLSQPAIQPEKIELKTVGSKAENAMEKLNIKTKKSSLPSIRTIVTAIEIGVGITAGVALTLYGGIRTYFYFNNRYHYNKMTQELKESYSQFINNFADNPTVFYTFGLDTPEANLIRSSYSRLTTAVSCFNRNATVIDGGPEDTYKIGYRDKYNQTKIDALEKLKTFNEKNKQTRAASNEENKEQLKQSATELTDCVMLHIDAIVDGSPYAPFFDTNMLLHFPE
jgi:hypothetical protein